FALLRELGYARVPVVTTVHDMQVVDSVPRDPTDQPLSVIATPTNTIRVKCPSAAPLDIDWTRLGAEDLQQMPVLAELKKKENAERLKSLADRHLWFWPGCGRTGARRTASGCAASGSSQITPNELCAELHDRMPVVLGPGEKLADQRHLKAPTRTLRARA